MKAEKVQRPKSLQEVAAESRTYRDFGLNLKDFLHHFEEIRRQQLPLAPLLSDEPARLTGQFPEGNICDSFLAATADYLSRVNKILTPAWALQEDLVLKEPWFSEEYLSLRMRLLRDTPSAFKDKNIFVFESALSVA